MAQASRLYDGDRTIMRTFFAGLSLLFGILLVVGFFALYYWVPRVKMVIIDSGATPSSGELLLITVSDLVVNYWYLILPVIAAVSYGAWRVAFADESASPHAEL